MIILLQSWRPRYGKDRANDETKDWVIEVPDGAGMFSLTVNKIIRIFYVVYISFLGVRKDF